MVCAWATRVRFSTSVNSPKYWVLSLAACWAWKSVHVKLAGKLPQLPHSCEPRPGIYKADVRESTRALTKHMAHCLEVQQWLLLALAVPVTKVFEKPISGTLSLRLV
jgi:hypothetical protein